MRISEEKLSRLIEAVHDRKPVSGLTHAFYRYPARFSPRFARATIEVFTEPGDLVYDPFMGGGTTLVEACALGRKAIGTDINSLAVFVSKVKTTPLTDKELLQAQSWLENLGDSLNLRNPVQRATKWIDLGYQRNISSKTTWPIRKILELALAKIDGIQNQGVQDFVRCVLLRTGQWALDCKKQIPTAEQFRCRFASFMNEMIKAAMDYRRTVHENGSFGCRKGFKLPACFHRSSVGIEKGKLLVKSPVPTLILTSPPYPGVHVLYHRWQVNGRRETPVPFWIANSLDGNGASFYTCGDRKQPNQSSYYQNIRSVFTSLARISDNQTLVVQLIAFPDPSCQLPRYLEVMEESGFIELQPTSFKESPDGRLWRTVPNRKFYTDNKSQLGASKEVALFHRLALLKSNS